jgi:hypothetical protein
MRSDEIKKALARHYPSERWVFLTEVKTGPTWFAGPGELLKIDAVAIRKSWSHPIINAYEVKVSRSDFLGDLKWPGYLPYCHRFYWACPTGLIKDTEVSEQAGLIYVSKTGGLKTVKKALFRHIDMPTSMFYHLLISHTENDRHPFFSDRREYALAYIEDRAARQSLAARFKTSLMTERDELRGKISNLETEIKSSASEREILEDVKKVLDEHGIRRWNIASALRDRLKEQIPPDLRRDLIELKKTLNRLQLDSE